MVPLSHSTCCLAETWLSEVDSLFSLAVVGHSTLLSSFLFFCIVVDAEPAAQWAGAAATWTPFFMLLPALSRAEPEFFIRMSTCKARRKAAIPSAFFLFDEKQINLRKRFPYPSPPSSSLSFSGKGYAPYLNVGRHSGILLFEPRVNIGSNMIGGVLATPCVQYKKKPLGSSRDYKKRVLSCVALKKGQRRRRSSTFFLPPAPA